MRQKSLITVSLVMAVTLMAGLSGCGDAGGEAKTKAPVILYIQQMNFSEPFYSSVGNQSEDIINTIVGVSPIYPSEETSLLMDVIVKGYEISYYRKDTGTRVPHTFTGNVNVHCPVNGTSNFGMIICRATQKTMPPLKELCSSGYDYETGLTVIHTACRAVVWGETFAGERVVSKPATMSVHFACSWN